MEDYHVNIKEVDLSLSDGLGIEYIADSDGPGSGTWRKIRVGNFWEATVYYQTSPNKIYLYIRCKDNNGAWTSWKGVELVS